MAMATSDRWQKPSGFLPIVGPVLDSLITPITAEGAAIVALDDHGGMPVQLYATRPSPPAMLDAVTLLSAGSMAPSHGMCPGEYSILAGPWQVGSGPKLVLVFWREKAARPWKKQDHALVLTAAAALTALLMHGVQPRTDADRRGIVDSITGLPKARKFITELPRYFARLDRENLPGSLILVNVVGYDRLIAELGRKTGDTVLRKAAELLVRVTRPADFIARLRDDEFAMWLSGADHFTAAERAEQLRIDGPGVLSMAVKNGVLLASLSVGIATRHSGSKETPGSLMRRADYALHEAKAVGPWTWRLSQEVVG